MLSKLLAFCFLFFSINFAYSQLVKGDFEKYPVFEECDSVSAGDLKVCFNATLIAKVTSEFKMPQRVLDENYTGELIVLFEVTKEGKFEFVERNRYLY